MSQDDKIATSTSKKANTFFQVPVLGFNSAKNDLNLLKSKLCRHLNLDKDDDSFTTKKENRYICISASKLKFLDITQFLAHGCSCAKFPKAYQTDVAKGLNSFVKLEVTELPPYEEFFSSLKKYICYYIEKSCTPPPSSLAKARKCYKTTEWREWGVRWGNWPGKCSKDQNYEYLRQILRLGNMRSMRDFLVWYNNFDVGAFVTVTQGYRYSLETKR